MNILSTHDTARLITVLFGENMEGKSKDEMSKTFIPENKVADAKNLVKIASLLQFTLCGVPSVYYGDEIGMQGYIDPLNRRCYDWNNQDKELLEWYKFLGKLRAEYSALKNGEFEEIFANSGVYVFSRKNSESELLVAINCGNESTSLYFDGVLTDLVSNLDYVNEFELFSKAFAVLVKK